MADGSENVIITGVGKARIFKGLTQVGSLIGARLAMLVGPAFAGLGRLADDTVVGSVFRVLGAIFYIGAGRLTYNGADTGIDATTTLTLQRIDGNSLTGVEYQAGLAQPSAPIITAVDPPSTYSGKNNGTVSVKLARVRSATGARSIASLSSNVVVCKNQCVAVQFPEADANGQDYWEIDVTLNGYGGIGNHYFLDELAESVFSSPTGIITPITAKVTSSSAEIGIPNDTLEAANKGWLAQSYQVETATVNSGDVSTGGTINVTVTAAGMTGSPKAVSVTLANNDNATTIATKIRAALTADADVGHATTGFFTVSGTNRDIVLTTKTYTANDSTMNIAIGSGAGVTAVATSVNTAVGINTYVVDIDGDGTYTTGGATNHQKITLNASNAAAPASGTQTITFTRGINGVDRTYVFEWADADLAGSDFAPTRDYPPPAGTHGGVSGDVVFVDGCYGENANTVTRDSGIAEDASAPGSAIAISDPARPESFPPDNYLFTGDTPTAILEGGQGVHWRFGRHSLGVIRYIGGSPALSYEMLWAGIGVAGQNNVALGAGGRLYVYTGARGACRLGPNGEPDVTFATKVSDDFAAWQAEEGFDPANVIVGFDANYGYVLFAYNRTILCYYEALDAWCAPIVVPASINPNGSIRTMVTVNGAVYLSIDDGTSIDIFGFDIGPGTSGKFVTQWVPSVTESDVISRIRLALRTDAASTVTTKVYTNGSSTASSTQSLTTNGSGFAMPTTLRPNVRNARMWRVEVSWTNTGGDAGVEGIIVEGESSGITI